MENKSCATTLFCIFSPLALFKHFAHSASIARFYCQFRFISLSIIRWTAVSPRYSTSLVLRSTRISLPFRLQCYTWWSAHSTSRSYLVATTEIWHRCRKNVFRKFHVVKLNALCAPSSCHPNKF